MSHLITFAYVAQDADLMEKLHADLTAQGWTVQTITPDTASQAETQSAIHATNCCVVIYSGISATSQPLRDMMQEAESHNKPIVAVFTQSEHPSAVEAFNKHRWDDLRNPEAYQTYLPSLIDELKHLLNE